MITYIPSLDVYVDSTARYAPFGVLPAFEADRPVIERPNQAWACDITYLPMARGFVYLVAILDLYSRKVMAWRTSNTLSTDFCVEALQEALTHYGSPEVE